MSTIAAASSLSPPGFVSPLEKIAGSSLHHAQRHADLMNFLTQKLPVYRLHVGIEEVWACDLRVVCPPALAGREACVSWDSEVWFARLSFRCDLSLELADWDLYHELCELQTWRTANLFVDVCESSVVRFTLLSQMQEQYRIARNQEIEWRIYGITGMHRPGHLVEEPAEQLEGGSGL